MNTNQQAMMQKMMTYANANSTRNPPMVHSPPPMHFNIPTIGTFQRWKCAGRQKARMWAWRTGPCHRSRWTPSNTHPIHRLFGTPRWDGCEHCASFCPRSFGSWRGCTKHVPNVLQHCQKIQQHEHVFLMRLRCGERPHIPYMSPSMAACKPSRGIESK